MAIKLKRFMKISANIVDLSGKSLEFSGEFSDLDKAIDKAEKEIKDKFPDSGQWQIRIRDKSNKLLRVTELFA